MERVIELPPLFFDELSKEHDGVGQEVKRNSRTVKVSADDAALTKIVQAAVQFSDVGAHGIELQGFCFSARAALSRLQKQVSDLLPTVNVGDGSIKMASEGPSLEIPTGPQERGRLTEFGELSAGDVIRHRGEMGHFTVKYIDTFDGGRQAEVTAIGGLNGHTQWRTFFIDRVVKAKAKGRKVTA